MRRLTGWLFSTRFTGFLLLLVAIAMAAATFIENDYGTMTARALVYHAWWFQVALFLLALNFAGNISRYRLWQRDKFGILLFHAAFYLILMGAALTHWIGYEGRMPIREGQSTNRVITDRVYLRAHIDDNREQRRYPDEEMELSAWGRNHLSRTYDFHDKAVYLKLLNYIPLAVKQVVRDVPGGSAWLHVVVSDGHGRQDHYIKKGQIQSILGMGFAFDRKIEGAIQIYKQDGVLKIKSPFDGVYRVMATQQSGAIQGDSVSDLHLRSLYRMKGIDFVISEVIPRAKLVLKPGDKQKNAANPDALALQLRSGNQTKNLTLFGKKSVVSPETLTRINGLNVYLSYGSKSVTLPFSIKLRDFQMTRYPGSKSPSSYASEVTVIDKGKQTDYRIFMNHVLDYGGNRFFQASYFPDERGTILSVNHDFWGTWVSYAGYILMALGMLLTLFSKGSRFWGLNEKLKAIEKRKTATVILLLLSLHALAQQPATGSDSRAHSAVRPPAHSQGSDTALARLFHSDVDRDSLVQAQYIRADKAADFGSLVVQRFDGRMEPINTLATDVLRKVAQRNTFSYRTKTGKILTMTPDQVFLGMHYDPMAWQLIPLIYVPKALQKELAGRLKIYHDHATALAFFDERADYIMRDYVRKAYQKRAADQNKLDKDVIAVDERVNITWSILQGNYLRIFPKPKDPNHTWYTYTDKKADFKGVDSLVQQKLIPSYFDAINRAKQSGDWSTADKILSMIANYQKKIGAAVMPSPQRIKWEIRYNKYNIFFNLMLVYASLGMLLLALSFTALFNKARWVSISLDALTLAIFIAFVLHLGGLALRWYITAHPPWSSGYEATTFIAAITVISGLISTRKDNRFALAMAALVAVILMGIAYGNLMTPQLTNLEPVLKSYWLMIHVAIITSSYGFLGLGSFLGLIVLVIISVRNRHTGKKFDLVVEELSYINEITLTIGLFMLTVGMFLGGVWANESWGRYWGWDPKETWALISVMVYTFVLHSRLIPGLRGFFAFNALSLLAISSLIMTYFGVNYYLSGLHSYAKGDPIPIPIWVYVAAVSVFLLVIVSYLRDKNYQNDVK